MFKLVQRVESLGNRIPLTLAVPLAGFYLAVCALWATGAELHGSGIFLAFVPAWPASYRMTTTQCAPLAAGQ